jgi:pimeloyl-ACP methyl ester carboxylesterase
VRQFLLSNLVRDKESSSLVWRIPIDILGRSLDHLGDFPFKGSSDARYSGRTLFVRGTKSHYVADDSLPAIGKFFPRFELRDVEAGHWVTSENPEGFRKGRFYLYSPRGVNTD